MREELTVIDFETEGIEERPKYPPKPVGVSIIYPGKKARYLAWGHPTENNTTLERARKELADIWRNDTLLFHNAKFDLDVAQRHFDLSLPPWGRVHDTLYTLFLTDPHSDTLSLKPSAERWLGLKPEEQDAVHQWLIDHNIVTKAERGWGRAIGQAPGALVGKYANGDTLRTLKLHRKLYAKLDARMKGAYDRERKLMPILLDNEKQGIRFDMTRAEEELPRYEIALKRADAWLCKRLKADINLDADAQLAEALDKAGVVTDWTWTKGGHGRDPQRSVSKVNLTLERFKDAEVFRVLGYRSRLQTVLALNLRPWLAMAQANKGFIYTEWNQVRQTHGIDNVGTRTGRLSCSRFQNISKSFTDKGDGYEHPHRDLRALPSLPLMRKYLLPDKSEVFVHRDYSQQEFRILAHYEDDALQAAYKADPRIDYHALMKSRVEKIAGKDYERRLIKILNFAINYGTGVAKLAQMCHIDLATAKTLREATKRAAPGVAALDAELKRRGREGEPIRTWGGRLYHCEPPAYSEKYKREMTYEYKLLNYLIQGSAADCTKEAIIRYDTIKKRGRLLATVHDEINLSAPRGFALDESELLRQAMESIEFDVPMLTDAKFGPSWGDLKEPKNV